MTGLSLQWLLARARRPATMARSRWPAIVTRHLAPARRPVPPGRRAYPDLFFADPAAVEDDSRRMRHGTDRAAPQPSWPASQWRLPD
jgi:hypothetical protein